MKRRNSDTNIDNPAAKPEPEYSHSDLALPASLRRSISPPLPNPRRLSRKSYTGPSITSTSETKSTTAAVEAGELQIRDHVSFFSSKLLTSTRPPVEGQPRLSHSDWLALYNRNLNDRGHHFVVHQHDHPIAGTHYDLRLQCNASSSISFAIMYGLPGNPNSRKLNRNATETRVHNLWNHLIETASHDTGTMLLWDTGEYEVLAYNPSSGRTSATGDATSTEDSDLDVDSDLPGKEKAESEPSKLHRAFQNRKIKLRLHGTRLPKNYTLNLRLSHENNRFVQPDAPPFKRRKRNHQSSTGPLRREPQPEETEASDSGRSSSPLVELPSDSDLDHLSSRRSPRVHRSLSSLVRTASPPRSKRSISPRKGRDRDQEPTPPTIPVTTQAVRSDWKDHLPPLKKPAEADVGLEDEEEASIRLNNAYPGATNSINSIHQRRWFLSLDRAACGFRPTNQAAFGRKVWERPRLSSSSEVKRESKGGDEDGAADDAGSLGGFEPFHVLGRDVEVSVLTGRTAADVARDEGLVGYKPRGGWRGVVE
ncbi:uncharacterized protein Z519_00372 [Cladophialophora bantiana CBS 173.52]|uniref:DNA ligase D 3'-phosphoesterase domain-containing protein n=1 Tax=Cladophialophora bantiana (strain ATCC 10958 / CBS 173.52 / CDC B-1940 / NIH 8579) TaxID=1442370 RepID=A0A0D2I609_CLAB1|nr:uncharacterized protein Z519_00372 [Cladophialophora bantiana CBS 173.52]KIW98710.1 hypothetical protein Z519_00372 [Cladophialophora bantiana CBS 173.52]